MARAAVGLMVAIVVAAAVLAGRPFFTDERDYPASIPQPTPLFSTTVIPVRPGERACFRDAVIEERSEEARFKVGTRLRPGIPLRLAIRGPGYSYRATVTGYRDNDVVRVPVRRPRRALPVQVCIANAGRRVADLYSAADRTRSRSVASVGGKNMRAGVVFSFWERTPRSIGERLPVTMERISAFRPGFVGPWLLWPLAVLFAIGVPVAVIAGFARSLRAP